MYKVTRNPDSHYVKNKLKAIQANNGYCLNCPKTEDWKCNKHEGCPHFQQIDHDGWCDEGVFYKERVQEANV